MLTAGWKQYLQYTDARRDLVVPGDKKATLNFCVEHFITVASKSIQEKGLFSVALSGGKTPEEIFQRLSIPENASKVDWKKVCLFWSDERAVPPHDAESNYRMAMEAGLKLLPIPSSQIFRMHAEEDIQKNASLYEKMIQTTLPQGRLDLVILGIGEDGHTASLFPDTEGLKITQNHVIANFVPSKNCWRMTLSFEGIHSAKNICVYVIGNKKSRILTQILSPTEEDVIYPAQRLGTPSSRSLWIADIDAARELIEILNS